MHSLQHLANYVYARAEIFRLSHQLPPNCDPQGRVTVNGVIHDFLHYQTNLSTSYADEDLLVWIEENLADSASFSIPAVLQQFESNPATK
jgi:hypothetical protein